MKNIIYFVSIIIMLLSIGCSDLNTPVTPVQPENAVRPKSLYTYTIKIKTGDVQYAGTDATVRIWINGRRNGGFATLGKWFILDDPNRNDFERNTYDNFYINTDILLTELTEMVLKHDNTGSKPGWYVEYVDVFGGGTPGQPWRSTVNTWLQLGGGYTSTITRPFLPW